MLTFNVIVTLIVSFLSFDVEGWLMSPVRPPAVSTKLRALLVPDRQEGTVKSTDTGTVSMVQKAISYFEARDLKYDIAMGLTEGAVFEISKVFVDLAIHPWTDIQISHSLNSQDELQYLIRGLVQEIFLNMAAPAVYISQAASKAMSQDVAKDDSSKLPLLAEKRVSLLVDLESFSKVLPLPVPLEAPTPFPSYSTVTTESSLLQKPSFGADDDCDEADWHKPCEWAGAGAQGQDLCYDDSWSSALMPDYEIEDTYGRWSPQFSFALPGKPPNVQQPRPWLSFPSGLVPQVIGDDSQRRRIRVATVVILRSFVAPLLIHSLGHTLPSFLSHGFVEEMEDLVEMVDGSRT
jgi:hypothetical protein